MESNAGSELWIPTSDDVQDKAPAHIEGPPVKNESAINRRRHSTSWNQQRPALQSNGVHKSSGNAIDGRSLVCMKSNVNCPMLPCGLQ